MEESPREPWRRRLRLFIQRDDYELEDLSEWVARVTMLLKDEPPDPDLEALRHLDRMLDLQVECLPILRVAAHCARGRALGTPWVPIEGVLPAHWSLDRQDGKVRLKQHWDKGRQPDQGQAYLIEGGEGDWVYLLQDGQIRGVDVVSVQPVRNPVARLGPIRRFIRKAEDWLPMEDPLNL